MSRAFAVSSRIDLRPGGWQFYCAAMVALFVAYGLAFMMTFGVGFGRALLYALVPATGLAVMAIPATALIRHRLFKLSAAIQPVAHVVTALAFAILLYWLRTIINGVVVSGDLMQIELPNFFAPAAAWMLIEGVLLYVLLALTSYIDVLLRGPVARLPGETEAPNDGDSPFRLFVRQDEEFRPIDPARIVHARGADDYAEVVTEIGTHLVRMTLALLGERLGPRFIRVHRSWLVNVERIAKVEPAGGGRMLLHMDDGAMITTSRAGTKLLREHIV